MPETALIYGFGKSSPGDLPFVSTLQTDPYYMSPLWPDKTSLAALQAQLLMNKGLLYQRQDMYDCINSIYFTNAKNNPNALVSTMHPVKMTTSQLIIFPLHYQLLIVLQFLMEHLQ